jgi:hypothetical protein
MMEEKELVYHHTEEEEKMEQQEEHASSTPSSSASTSPRGAHRMHSPYTLEMFQLGKEGCRAEQAELIEELSTSLNNLKWGFRKR